MPEPRRPVLPRRPLLLHRLAGCLVVALAMTGTAGALRAEPVALDFEPPDIPLKPICLPRESDANLEMRWGAWSGRSLSGLAPALVQRDFRRLLEIDAQRWGPVYERVLGLMHTIDASFGPEKLMVERVAVLIAEGRAEEVEREGLIGKVMASEAIRIPAVQRVMGEHLMLGQGVTQDRAKGISLLVGAAYGGDAGAIMQIAELQQRGLEVPDWPVEPKMTLMMGFSATVGSLDPLICDRTVAIARAYKNGEIVRADPALALRWYRFAADLGDANAAWSVAEMQLRSEEVRKDNAVLLRYLAQAARGGAPHVLLQLGRLYETGGVVDQDLARAESLYARASEGEWRAGLIRQTLFLQSRAASDPARQKDYLSSLGRLLARGDAPGWAYVAKADDIVRSNGRWVSEDEVLKLYDIAADAGNEDAIRARALIRMHRDPTPAGFYAAVDQLVFTVEQSGKTGPVFDLIDAFLCRAPDAPNLEQAGYWREVAAANGMADRSAGTVGPKTAAPDTVAAAVTAAQAGSGKALRLLTKLDPATYPGADAVYARFAPDIAARGDFDAILLALPHLKDAKARSEYLLRARASMACTPAQTADMAEAWAEIGDKGEFRRWFSISRELAGSTNPAVLTRLGDMQQSYAALAEDAGPTSKDLWQAAYAAGDKGAIYRLLPDVADPKRTGFDPERAAEYYVALVKRSSFDDLPKVLDRISKAPAPVKGIVTQQIDPEALYKDAADHGNIVAMREYARLLQLRAKSPSDVGEAVLWTRTAAEGGDVPAMVDYARALAFGLGGPVDVSTARLWLDRAAAAGSPEAEALVNSLRLSGVVTQ